MNKIIKNNTTIVRWNRARKHFCFEYVWFNFFAQSMKLSTLSCQFVYFFVLWCVLIIISLASIHLILILTQQKACWHFIEKLFKTTHYFNKKKLDVVRFSKKQLLVSFRYQMSSLRVTRRVCYGLLWCIRHYPVSFLFVYWTRTV